MQPTNVWIRSWNSGPEFTTCYFQFGSGGLFLGVMITQLSYKSTSSSGVSFLSQQGSPNIEHSCSMFDVCSCSVEHWTWWTLVFEQWTLNIEHWTSKNSEIIEHWTFEHRILNVEHWTPNIEHWTMNIEHWTSNIEHSRIMKLSNIEQWTSNNEHRTLNFEH